MNKIKWDVLAVWVGAILFCIASWAILINALSNAVFSVGE